MGFFDRLLGTQTVSAPSPSAPGRDALAYWAPRLALVGDEERVAGRVEGLDVSIARDLLHLGTNAGTSERLLVKVRFPVRLDLGLHISRTGSSDPRAPFATGHGAFDGMFLAIADEAERGRALISGEVTERLLGGPETDIADAGLTVAVGLADAARLGEAVAYAVALSQTIERQRAATPAAAALRDFEAAWASGAEGRGVLLETAPLSAKVQLGRIASEVRAVRDGFGQFHFELRAAFPEPLGLELVLRPQNAGGDALRELDDPSGERAFDRYFAATARNVSLGALFDMQTRSILVDLRNAGLQVRADDRAVTAWLGFRKDDLAAPLRHLWPLAAVADAVARQVGEPTQRR